MTHSPEIKLAKITKNEHLHRVCFLTIENQIYYAMNLGRNEHYPLLFAENIFGKILRLIPLKDCVVIKYFTLSQSERISLLQKSLTNAAISFPFPLYPKEIQQIIASDNYWDNTSAEKLDADERVLRDTIIANLNKYIDKSKKYTVYDPACSSGTFLAQLVNAYTNLTPIASDISPKMVELAKTKLPDVFVSDAKLSTQHLNTEVDILILRFLNYEVVEDDIACEIIEQLVKIVKNDGIIVAFGYTPVLNIVPSFLVSIGWQMINAVFEVPNQNALVQGYIFAKH